MSPDYAPTPTSGYAAQSVQAPLTGSAIFLVVVVSDAVGAAQHVREVLADLDGLVKTVGFREPSARLSCTVGIGAKAWPAVVGGPKPAELHPFKEFHGAKHTAPGTPGDLLFHIRADRQDLCFELERLLLESLGDAVEVADEVSGFRFFDNRDLLGFVDGTANPIGTDLPASTLIGDEDPAFAGGSYVVVQKYVHPLSAWQRLSVEQQEAILGRTKLENVELADATSGQKSHKTLTTIVDADGVEHDILRDNMPFGSPGAGVFGTYFIGYSRHLWVTEKMLERMFIGDPPGLHDRLLDFSTAETGSTFFVPTAAFLADLDQPAPTVDDDPPADPPAPDHTSLGIGSLRTPH